MNLRLTNSTLLIFFLVILSGCELIEDVFEFGFWFAIILIVVIIAILVLIFNSVSYKPKERENIAQKVTDSG